MERITKISAGFDGVNSPIQAILAAFSHFQSLTDGVDGKKLAEEISGYAISRRKTQPDIAREIMALVLSTLVARPAVVRFGLNEVSLWPNESETEISVYRNPRAGSFVEVDFGPHGSVSRACAILSVAEQVGVQFNVWSREGLVDRKDIMNSLYQRAAAKLDTRLRSGGAPVPQVEVESLTSEVNFFQGRK